MNDGKVNWQGNMPAVVTPFKADGAIDEAKFTENIEWLMAEGVDGVVVTGCTGEAWAVGDEEKMDLFRLTAKIAKGRITVIGGVGTIVTAKVIELTNAAKETGIDGVMILPPYYAQPEQNEVVAHYQAISDGSQFPIMVYNIPSRTGINLTPGYVEELADVDYVVALKESHDDFVQLEATVARVGDKIKVFSGFAAVRAVAAVTMGCVGLISSMDAQLMGGEAISMYALTKEGNIGAARLIQQRALSLVEGLHSLGSEASVLKAAMNLIGRPGGHVRPPLLDLEGTRRDAVAQVLTNHGFAL
jgi:4-hydroxy-tetrahydrodipicolinate synthase